MRMSQYGMPMDMKLFTLVGFITMFPCQPQFWMFWYPVLTYFDWTLIHSDLFKGYPDIHMKHLGDMTRTCEAITLPNSLRNRLIFPGWHMHKWFISSLVTVFFQKRGVFLYVPSLGPFTTGGDLFSGMVCASSAGQAYGWGHGCHHRSHIFHGNKTNWLVVWNMAFMTFPSYWECHHPNWQTPSFFRGVGIRPTRLPVLSSRGYHTEVVAGSTRMLTSFNQSTDGLEYPLVN